MAGGAPSLKQQALQAYFYVVLWMGIRRGPPARSCAAPAASPGARAGQSAAAAEPRARRPARSMAVILFNKWLLAYSGFPFPLALTMCAPARRADTTQPRARQPRAAPRLVRLRPRATVPAPHGACARLEQRGGTPAAQRRSRRRARPTLGQQRR
jgi:hypothetical protein